MNTMGIGDSYSFVFVAMICPSCRTKYAISPDPITRMNILTINILTGDAMLVAADAPMRIRTDIACDKSLEPMKCFAVQTKSGEWLMLEPKEEKS